MKLKRIFSLSLIICGIFIIAGCGLNEKSSSTNTENQADPRCQWDQDGTCESMIKPGYAYNKITNKCEYFAIGNSCEDPPFKTKEECETICLE